METHVNARSRAGWRVPVVAVALLLAACSPPGAANVSAQRTSTITRGTLVATVNATGNIQPEAQLALTFQQPGTVAEVDVRPGDTVKRGDVLAKLDAADLELALQQAQVALVVAESAYSRTLDTPPRSDVDAAQASLNAALAAYEKLKAGPAPEDYASATGALANASAGLKQAQMAYDQAYRSNPAGISGSPAALQLEQATNAYNTAKAQVDKASQPASAAQLSAALQQIAGARASLDRLQQPVKAYDVEQARAQVQQARIQVAQAQRHLGQATLLAPRSGVITAVSIKAGELAGAQAAMTLVDLSRLHIDITVDEIDVAKLHAGQETLVTLDALPDVSLKGAIDRIAPTSTTIGGVVSYDVRVVLADPQAALKPGMTANTSVVLERRENALLAPNWAIRRDRATGKSYITVQAADKTAREVEVITGLHNETQTEITSGVAEGQVILAPQTSSLLMSQ